MIHAELVLVDSQDCNHAHKIDMVTGVVLHILIHVEFALVDSQDFYLAHKIVMVTGVALHF